MRVPWRRLTWLLVAAVPIAAIAGFAWVATRDLSRYQARLTEQIRKVTGRELAAKVPLAVKLGSPPLTGSCVRDGSNFLGGRS